MSVVVVETENGWSVVRDGQQVAFGLSHREAWRMADRLKNEPVNRSENVSEWIFAKEANYGSE